MSELTAEQGDSFTVGKLRDAAQRLGVRSIQDGSWFRRVVTQHVKAHGEKVNRSYFDRIYPGVAAERRAELEIRKVSVKAAGAGALASVGASTGELLSLFTEGLAAPVGVPATMLAMGLEAAYTTTLQIDLACDLGVIYDIPFNANDFGEIATLFALALEMDVYSKKEKAEDEEADEPRGLMSRLIHLEEGEIGTRIGRKLLEESVLKNVIPVVGIPISARWNYVATGKLGAKVRKYMRYRHALRDAAKELHVAGIIDPSLLVKGAWLLATVDGEAGHEEMLALASVMDLLTPEQRQAIADDATFGDDEEAWFDALATVDKEMHAPLLDTLYLVAAADRELAVPEKRFLRRIGKALGREIDFERVEQTCRHLTHGERPPPRNGA